MGSPPARGRSPVQERDSENPARQTYLAEELFQQSLATANSCDYRRGQAYAVNGLALVAQRRGDIDLAESLLRRAQAMASAGIDPRLSGMIELNLGVLSSATGDLDSAMWHYRDSRAAFERARDLEGIYWALANMGALGADPTGPSHEGSSEAAADAHLRQADAARSQVHLEYADRIFAEIDEALEEAETRVPCTAAGYFATAAG